MRWWQAGLLGCAFAFACCGIVVQGASEFAKKTRDKVTAQSGYTSRCSSSQVEVTITNKSDRPLKEAIVLFNVFRPGSSAEVNRRGTFTWKRIVESGASEMLCVEADIDRSVQGQRLITNATVVSFDLFAEGELVPR